jgi:ABC-2 type transport system permease protein
MDVKVDLDLFPQERNLSCKGTYVLKNKSKEGIDSVLLIIPTMKPN